MSIKKESVKDPFMDPLDDPDRMALYCTTLD